MKPRCRSVVFLLVFLAGCKTAEHSDTGTVNLRFWHSFVSTSIPSVDTLLQAFESENPGIRINAQYVPTGDGLIQKLVTAVQSRTAPDISWIHPDFLDKLVDAGALYGLEDFIHGNDSLPASEIEDIYAPLLEAGKIHGVIYSLPMEATSLALLYNKSLFRKAGLDPEHPPENWQELVDYTARLTRDLDGDGRTDQYGFFVPVFPASGELNIWMTLQWTPFLWQAGGSESNPAGTEAQFNSEAGVEALALWKRLYAMEDFSRFGIAHDIGFASGKLAMILDGPWNLPRYRAKRDLDWAVAPLPAGPKCHATYIAGEQLAIFRQSAHPREAWKFIRWILRADVQARFSISSGYLPVRRSALLIGEYRAFLGRDVALKSFVDQMGAGRGRRVIERHRVEFNRALAEAIEKATLGGMDPKQCLDEAARSVNEVLK